MTATISGQIELEQVTPNTRRDNYPDGLCTALKILSMSFNVNSQYLKVTCKIYPDWMSGCLCSCQRKDKISLIELIFQLKRKIISYEFQNKIKV